MLICLVAGILHGNAVAADDGSTGSEQTAYLTHCSACHLANGQGVPSAFPPFDARIGRWAGSEAGRDYLVSVVSNGLFGPISVNGVPYAGAMPQMSHIDVAEIAGALSYVVTTFGEAADAAFTADELTERRGRIGTVQSRTLRPND